VDPPVLAAAPAAHGQQGRPAAEVDAELVFDHATQRCTGQGGDKPAESRPAGDAVGREAAVAADLRKISKKPGQHLAPHKFLDDDEIERVADERRRAQTIEIEDVQALLLF
jgi:hypothetical protein